MNPFRLEMDRLQAFLYYFLLVVIIGIFVEIELDLLENKGNPKLINSEATFVWLIVLNRSTEYIER